MAEMTVEQTVFGLWALLTFSLFIVCLGALTILLALIRRLLPANGPAGDEMEDDRWNP